jgi:hypothetical protein
MNTGDMQILKSIAYLKGELKRVNTAIALLESSMEVALEARARERSERVSEVVASAYPRAPIPGSSRPDLMFW